MWLPKSIYERIPQFYFLAGLLLITDGLYLGAEISYSYSYAYFGLGFASLTYGVGLFVMRKTYRKAKRLSQAGSEDGDSATTVEEFVTSPEASDAELSAEHQYQSQQIRDVNDKGA